MEFLYEEENVIFEFILIAVSFCVGVILLYIIDSLLKSYIKNKILQKLFINIFLIIFLVCAIIFIKDDVRILIIILLFVFFIELYEKFIRKK